jgi:transcriptional regulator with XRE-family HTH domain
MVRVTSQPAATRDPLSLRVGGRIRRARTRAGLTQQQVAGERYSKAYVSALENGLIKPSVTALDYLAGRLGTTSGWLMGSDEPTWTRLEADLQLAAGDWQRAIDAYDELLAVTTDREARAEILRGQAEAFARLDRGAEAVRTAAEAVELFEASGRHADAAVLEKVRGGLRVEPDFKLRLLMALSSNEAREGNHQVALSYLEEVRGLADTLDDRRRAVYLFDLAHSYRETGDFEAAMRTGYASLALFAASHTDADVGRVENEVALAHLGTGSLQRAANLAKSAHARLAVAGNERLLAHVIDTEAQIAAARSQWEEALRLSTESSELARRSKNLDAEAAAMLTAARVHSALSNAEAAEQAFAAAASLARVLKRPKLLKDVLTQWADYRAQLGDHAGAFALSREALASDR